MTLSARLLLDLGSVEERGDDGGRADPDRDAGFHELRPALLAGVITVVAVGHLEPLNASLPRTSMFDGPTMEAEG